MAHTPFTAPASQTVVVSLTVRGGAAALDFYVKAFGAVENFRMAGPDGNVWHAEMVIGQSVVMLSDEWPATGAVSPLALGGCPSMLRINVPADPGVDAAFDRAVAAGAQVIQPVQDMFWGERVGFLKDPFGYRWSLGMRTENVAPDEVVRRARTLFGGA